MLTYLNELEESRRLQDRPRFSPDGKVFRSPSWSVENVKLGIKLSLQSSSYTESRLNKWKNKLEGLEDIINREFKVYSTLLDINNDGKKEKIVSFSWSQEVGFYNWSSITFVVNKFNNIDMTFYDAKVPETISGEIFLYKGRAFSLDDGYKKYRVNEFFERTLFGRSGIVVKQNVCEFKK